MHIQQALGYNLLEYAHLPLVLGENKKRLSKRDAVTSLDEYLNLGYLPTSMINVLARLGWSKGDSEIFYMKDLLKDFRIQEVQKAAAIFNKTKLDWTNTNHLASLSDDEFIEKIRPFLDLKDISLESETDKKIILAYLEKTNFIDEDLLSASLFLMKLNEKIISVIEKIAVM